MQQQSASHLLMIRPSNFGYNPETAITNAFQKSDPLSSNLNQSVLKEFDGFVQKLKEEDIDVIIIQDTPFPIKPDAVFPNNWISAHSDGRLFLYPMQAENRRLERIPNIIEQLSQQGFTITKTEDLSYFEKEGFFLEGTGSIVLDHIHKIIYACLSPRTDLKVLQKFCELTRYHLVSFDAQASNVPIYHTNVMMSIGTNFATVCGAAIPKQEDKERVYTSLQKTHKQIIEISLEQMNSFAGNILEVQSTKGEKKIVLSEQALQILSLQQRSLLASFGKLIPVAINTIEHFGGGSARCMLAEIFLPQKNRVYSHI